METSCPTLAENVALDEVLLDRVERTGGPGILRFWEMHAPGIVVGRASRLSHEVDQRACERNGLPIIRRVSGGCAVMCGSGCLMYAVILPRAAHADLNLPGTVHRWVLDRMVDALGAPDLPVQRCGTSDLAVAGRKFSGNSVRLLRRTVLYHGTFLYNFDLALLQQYLPMPPREPTYRCQRTHADFLVNVPYSAHELRTRIRRAWNSHDQIDLDLDGEVAELVERRYGQDQWNLHL